MGDVAEKIVEYAADLKADMIIMGTHGYKGLEKIMFGSVADKVVQVFGGQGWVKERSIERFYRDVRPFRIYEGTSQIHQLNIARLLLRDAE